jgi:hypothetical protein
MPTDARTPGAIQCLSHGRAEVKVFRQFRLGYEGRLVRGRGSPVPAVGTSIWLRSASEGAVRLPGFGLPAVADVAWPGGDLVTSRSGQRGSG